MQTLTITEASSIIDTHEFHGINELWGDYPDLTYGELKALYELAWETLEAS